MPAKSSLLSSPCLEAALGTVPWLLDHRTYQGDHVPELLQQAQLPATRFKLFVLWERHLKQCS